MSRSLKTSPIILSNTERSRWNYFVTFRFLKAFILPFRQRIIEGSKSRDLHKNRNEIKERKGRSDAMIKATINNRNALFDVGICAGTSGLKARNISCLNRSPESFLLLFRAFEIYSETLTRRIVKEPFLRRRCRRMWNQKCNDKA